MYISSRSFFPSEWVKDSIPAGQVVGVPMDIAGFNAIKSFPFPRKASIVTVGIVLSQAVTSDFIRFALTFDGVEQSQTIDMVSADGDQKLWTFAPGKLVVSKGVRLGVNWGSHPSMTPDGVIEALVAFEVQQ